MSQGQSKLIASILHFGFMKTNTEKSTMQGTNTYPQNYKTAIKPYTLRQTAVLLSQPQIVPDTPAPHSLPSIGSLQAATSLLTSLGRLSC